VRSAFIWLVGTGYIAHGSIMHLSEPYNTISLYSNLRQGNEVSWTIPLSFWCSSWAAVLYLCNLWRWKLVDHTISVVSTIMDEVHLLNYPHHKWEYSQFLIYSKNTILKSQNSFTILPPLYFPLKMQVKKIPTCLQNEIWKSAMSRRRIEFLRLRAGTTEVETEKQGKGIREGWGIN
jgi:hypothetical protein